MKGSSENDFNEVFCISLRYLLSSSPRRQIYIISSVIKLSTPPSHSSLSAGDFTYYFTEKIEALRGELPHLPTVRLTNLYACLDISCPVTLMSSLLREGLWSHPFSSNCYLLSPTSLFYLFLARLFHWLQVWLKQTKPSLDPTPNSSPFLCSLIKALKWLMCTQYILHILNPLQC